MTLLRHMQVLPHCGDLPDAHTIISLYISTIYAHTYMRIARMCRPYSELIFLFTHRLHNLYSPGSCSEPSLGKLCGRHAQISDCLCVTSSKTHPRTRRHFVHVLCRIQFLPIMCVRNRSGEVSRNTTRLALAKIFLVKFSRYTVLFCCMALSLGHYFISVISPLCTSS